MALYERAQKILAGTCNNSFITPGIANRFWWRQLYGSIYLYTVLKIKANNMKAEKSKSTVLVISMGFLILHLIFLWQWAVYVSLVVGAAGIISSYLSRIIEKAWMMLAKVLSYIIPSILLGIVYYLFLFPISLISKLFTKDPLMLSKRYNTYFVNIDKEFDKENFKKIW